MIFIDAGPMNVYPAVLDVFLNGSSGSLMNMYFSSASRSCLMCLYCSWCRWMGLSPLSASIVTHSW